MTDSNGSTPIRCPDYLHKLLKAAAGLEGISLQAVLVEAGESWLREKYPELAKQIPERGTCK